MYFLIYKYVTMRWGILIKLNQKIQFELELLNVEQNVRKGLNFE
jgi:hypothetical protein